MNAKRDLWAWLTAGVVALQSVYFGAAVWQNRGRWLFTDNTFYETPAWHLAAGDGLVIARTEWEDPYLTALYHAAHPEARDSPFVPSVVFPPGYAVFLAGVYRVFGRSHLAGVLANWPLLVVAVIASSALLRRAFDRRLGRVGMGLMAVFPIWAYWAAFLVSDILHLALVSVFAWVWFVDRPSIARTFAAGLVLGAATLVRPYSILLPVVFAGAWAIRRVPAFSPRHVLVLALVVWATVAAWTGRNQLCFGRPIILTSMGLGQGLWLATSPTRDWGEITDQWRRLGVADPHRHHENQVLQDAALQRIRTRPLAYAAESAWNVLRRWVSLGGATPFVVRAGLAVLLGGLLATMIGGVWVCRRARHPVLVGSLGAVLYYSLVFIPISPEGRYMVPARPFAFVLSAAAIGALATRPFGRLASSAAGDARGSRPPIVGQP